MLAALREFAARSPLNAILLLLLSMFGGVSVASFVGFAIAQLLMGVPLLTDPSLAERLTTDPSLLTVLRMMQIMQALGMLVLPSLLHLMLEGEGVRSLFRSPLRQAVMLSVAVFLVLLPSINFMADLNAQVQLPGTFGAWALDKEAELARLTERFLDMPHVGHLLFNLVMIALLPAVGEELLFRGVLQRLVQRFSGRGHLAVWVGAIVFSAIHMQFLGFVPRLLMGAVLGYLLLWSGNLWYPIIAHFTNNAAAVVLAYAQQRNMLSVDVDTLGIANPMHAGLSLAMGLMLLYLFRQFIASAQVGEAAN